MPRLRPAQSLRFLRAQISRSFLSIFNNEGNQRTIYKGDEILTEADKTVTVTFKKPANLKVVVEGKRAAKIFPCAHKTILS